MIAVRRLLVGVLVASCASRIEPAPEFVLRVSTHHELAPMHPFQRQTLTANLGDLVYEPLGTHFATLETRGNVVVLSGQRAESKTALAELARSIEHPARPLVSIVGETLELAFSSSAAAAAIELAQPLLATGPYGVGGFEQNRRLELVRRHGTGPDRIVVLAYESQEEEWRHLMSHDVDLVPITSPTYAQYFEDMKSIRIVPVRQAGSVALLFNTKGALADRALRRSLALAINRSAIAAAITGDRSRATPAPGSTSRPALPSALHLRLILPESVTEFSRVAMILEQQLAPLGVTIAVTTVGVAELVEVARRGDFDLMILFGSYEPRDWIYLTCTSPGNFVGYCNDEFDRAAATGDEALARSIAARDVPLTPLYVRGEVVAMDAHLCGTAPDTVRDMSWLTTVHPCREDER